jgi:hypothetical protein
MSLGPGAICRIADQQRNFGGMESRDGTYVCMVSSGADMLCIGIEATLSVSRLRLLLSLLCDPLR